MGFEQGRLGNQELTGGLQRIVPSALTLSWGKEGRHIEVHTSCLADSQSHSVSRHPAGKRSVSGTEASRQQGGNFRDASEII